VHDPAQAGAVAGAVVAFAEALGRPLPVLGLGGEIEAAAAEHGIPFVREAFLDRGYARDGTLVPRGAPGAVLDSVAQLVERAIGLARDGEVVAVDGTRVRVDAASLCVHGDTPAAVTMAVAVRAALEREGITVRAPW